MATEILSAKGQQSGKAEEDVARLAGLQLREERGADDEEDNDQEDSGACAPITHCGKSHSDIEDVENGETKSDVKVYWIVAMILVERPEPAGVGQQCNARSEPHRGGAFDGNPEISPDGMTLRAIAR